ncbi:hypothetical protein EJ03DRAFT_174780 [Teratosphaeria nubilosa]|uniref:Uncharacterized protein n=1 Tax=Teratosphaeria nubilosa TaxID=161662 RepID=A0A6G1L330_9PEZI|nr:hypothetical protein EJ03DRAFT_174780 [Teratosphaeria nubilosa]
MTMSATGSPSPNSCRRLWWMSPVLSQMSPSPAASSQRRPISPHKFHHGLLQKGCMSSANCGEVLHRKTFVTTLGSRQCAARRKTSHVRMRRP